MATYTLSWKVSPIPGAPLVEEVNDVGYPLTFQARGTLGWEREYRFGRLFAHSFVNFRNSYRMDPQQLPIGVDPSYADIDAYTTFDLTLGFDTGDSRGSILTDNFSVVFSIQNRFDTDPPLVVNQAGLAGSAIRFDPTYGSPLGRVFQVQVGKRF